MKEGCQTFSVSLPDKNNFPRSQDYKYSSCRFIVVKLVNGYDYNDGVEYKGGLYSHFERDYYIEKKNLKPGKYLAFVEFDWHESVKTDAQDFVMTCYGTGKTRIQDETDLHKVGDFLKATFIAKLDYSRKSLHRIDFSDKGAP